MGKYRLGEFEEIVLLTVAILYDNAYGISIKEDIQERLDRKVSVGALQSALRRMEKKGFLRSRKGETNDVRGGRPKLLFTLTAAGQQALEEARDSRNQLWNAIPDGVLKLTS
ncbi:MAG: helix-turn-helix transcriptional regulator [Saprospiraceae bacterium]